MELNIFNVGEVHKISWCDSINASPR